MRPTDLLVDILCKVVDNFGDIGFAYRLARALEEESRRRGLQLRLRLVTDDLTAFKALHPAVDATANLQQLHGWTVARWSAPAAEFRSEPPRIVLECFACGRPDWYDEILFSEIEGAPIHIVNIEHLSAESYASDLHRLDSLTRSPRVKKNIFMPGFSAGTGGLVLDGAFLQARERFLDPLQSRQARRELSEIPGLHPFLSDRPGFWLSVFSYERDFSRIVADLALLEKDRPLLALVAHGKSQTCFLKAWDEAGRPFAAVALPFLPQEIWDRILLASDMSIVRGEDSLSRAALSGRPFLWQAYAQENRHQLVKVEALLARMRSYFPPTSFAALESLFAAFNERDRDDPSERGRESLLPVLRLLPELESGFRRFSEDLVALGNLAAHLLTFISNFV